MSLTTIDSTTLQINGSCFRGPFIDGNANIYAIVKTSSGISIYKSSNGTSWSVADSSATTRAVSEVSGVLVGTVLHIITASAQYVSGMDTLVDFNYFTFNTSDAGSTPDAFVIEEEAISTEGSVAPQVAIAVPSDGNPEIMQKGIFTSMGTNFDNWQTRRRVSGTWGSATAFLNEGVNQQQCQMVAGPSSSGSTFLFTHGTSGNTSMSLQASVSGSLQTRVAVDTASSKSGLARPIVIDVGGTDKLMLFWQEGVNLIRERREFTTSYTADISQANIQDASPNASSDNLGLAWDSSTGRVYVLWGGVDADLYTDSGVDGNTFGTDVELEDAITINDFVGAEVYTRSGSIILGYLVEETTAGVMRYGESVLSTGGFSETLSTSIAASTSEADTQAMAESRSTTITATTTAADGQAFTETLSTSITATTTMVDTFSFGETLSTSIVGSSTSADTQAMSETLASSVTATTTATSRQHHREANGPTYIDLDGTDDRIDTPDSTAFTINDDFQLIVGMRKTIDEFSVIASQFSTGPNNGWLFTTETDGHPDLDTYASGTQRFFDGPDLFGNSMQNLLFDIWLRVDLDISVSEARFFFSFDSPATPIADLTWWEWGPSTIPQTAITSINPTAVLAAGFSLGGVDSFGGRVYAMQLSVGGVVKASPDFRSFRPWNNGDGTDGQGNTWTLRANATAVNPGGRLTTSITATTTEADGLGYHETLSTSIVATTTSADQRSLSETLATSISASTTEADTQAMAEALATSIICTTTEADSVGGAFSETLSTSITATTTSADAFHTSETLATSITATTTSADQRSLTETLTTSIVSTTTEAETQAMAEALATSIVATTTEADQLSLTETLTTSGVVTTTLTDLRTLTETLATSGTVTTTEADTSAMVDALTTNIVCTTVSNDQLQGAFHEFLFTTGIVTTALSDALSGLETLSTSITGTTTETDGQPFAEALTTNIVATTTENDVLTVGVGFTEALATSITCTTIVADVLGATEALALAIVFTSILHDRKNRPTSGGRVAAAASMATDTLTDATFPPSDLRKSDSGLSKVQP